MITSDLMDRFFDGDLSPAETEELARWIEEDPSHKETFGKALDTYLLGLQLASLDSGAASVRPRRKAVRFITWAASIAAALAMGVFATWKLSVKPREEKMAQEVSVAAAPGHLSSLTLSDGTTVTLNSGSRLTYPAVFEGEREVSLEGEALFDVAKDPEHPFKVKTFRYEVTVTGTVFNVQAFSDMEAFSTSLIEGRVSVMDTKTSQTLNMTQGQEVRSGDGGLLALSNVNDIKSSAEWTSGIISCGGMPFEDVIRTFERAFGVKIIIRCEEMPENHLSRLKVWLSDGVENALNLLSKGSDFTYSYDPQTNTYYID